MYGPNKDLTWDEYVCFLDLKWTLVYESKSLGYTPGQMFVLLVLFLH